MANLTGLAGFVSELRAVRTTLVNELRHVDTALSVLGKFGGGSNYTKPKRGVPALARKRMSLAQKARWAPGFVDCFEKWCFALGSESLMRIGSGLKTIR
jgi:hypothetical protein